MQNDLLPLQAEQVSLDITHQHNVDNVRLITSEVEEKLHVVIGQINDALPKLQATVAAANAAVDKAVQVDIKAGARFIAKKHAPFVKYCTKYGVKSVTVVPVHMDQNSTDTKWAYKIDFKQAKGYYHQFTLGTEEKPVIELINKSKKILKLEKIRDGHAATLDDTQAKLLELTRSSQDMSRFERRGMAAQVRRVRSASKEGRASLEHVDGQIAEFCKSIDGFSKTLSSVLKALPAPKRKRK